MRPLFIETLWQAPDFFIAWVLVVVFSICCHEYMHALVAYRQGDDTAALSGHLTFNPLKQMGWISLILLCFVGIAWGAVPVDPSRLRRKSSRVLVALAGPLTNIALCVIGIVLCFLASRFQWPERAQWFFELAAVLNLALGLFNLLPVPPLDGYAAVRACFPELGFFRSEWINGAIVFLALLAFYCVKYLMVFASYCVGQALDFLFWVTT